MEEESVTKLIKFSKTMEAAINGYAKEQGLTRNGKPNFSAAARKLIGDGLKLDMALHDLKPGRPYPDESE